MINSLVNWSTSKRHISCLSLLKELVSRFIRGPMPVLQILNYLAYQKKNCDTPCMNISPSNVLRLN